MDKFDIMEYALVNNGFDIFDVYARFVTEAGASVFTGYHDFCSVLDEICATKFDTRDQERVFGRVKYNKDRFLQRMHESDSYVRHFYEYVSKKLGDKDKVWDIGCGAHPLSTIYLQEKGIDITGVDPQINSRFMDYFKTKYYKKNLQAVEAELVKDNPTMLIGFRPCSGQEPLLDMAQKYDKRVVTKSCECRIVTDSREAIFGEEAKTMYYLKKYPFLKLGSMLGTPANPDEVRVSMDTVMETD